MDSMGSSNDMTVLDKFTQLWITCANSKRQWRAVADGLLFSGKQTDMNSCGLFCVLHAVKFVQSTPAVNRNLIPLMIDPVHHPAQYAKLIASLFMAKAASPKVVVVNPAVVAPPTAVHTRVVYAATKSHKVEVEIFTEKLKTLIDSTAAAAVVVKRFTDVSDTSGGGGFR
jgi:hypothetical protein